MTTDEKSCSICGKPVNPYSPKTYRMTHWWECPAYPEERFTDSVLDMWAHGGCVAAEGLATPPKAGRNRLAR